MKKNIGTVDKCLRVIIGLGLLSLLFVLESPLAYLGFIGIVPIATSIFSFCPAYTLFGISTCALFEKK